MATFAVGTITTKGNDMKRHFTLLAAVALAAASVSLTGCDVEWYDDYDDYGWWNSTYRNPGDDWIDMADMLEGRWSGTLRAQGYDSRGYAIPSQYAVYDTQMEFRKASYNSVFGRGVQYDYSRDGGTGNFSRTFTWHIDTYRGDVYIVYDGDRSNPDFEMVIPYDELDLDNRKFTGYMYAVDESETDEFYLYRDSYSKKMTFVAEE